MEKWIEKVSIKTIKTMAQTAVGIIGSSAMLSDVDWYIVLSSVLLSGVVCVLMNISQIEEG